MSEIIAWDETFSGSQGVFLVQASHKGGPSNRSSYPNLVTGVLFLESLCYSTTGWIGIGIYTRKQWS